MGKDTVPKYWTESRKELREWLTKYAPTLGELYEGAVKILYSQKSFPGCSQFISHAVREIANRLPDCLPGIVIRGYVQYKNIVDGISQTWQAAGLPLGGALPLDFNPKDSDPPDEIPIPRKVYIELSKLLKQHEEARERPLDKAKRLFESIGPENRDSQYALIPVIKQWLHIIDWFRGKVHDTGKVEGSSSKSTEDNLAELDKHFQLFESTLMAFARSFFKTMGRIDEILEETNLRSD